MTEKKKRIRIEKRVVKRDGGTHVFAFAKGGDDEGEIDIETIEDAELSGSDLAWVSEDDENGHTVIKIRIPKGEREDGEPDALTRAAGVSGAIENLEADIKAIVRRARDQGYTWTQIGDALGISKQAAWERFSGEE